MVLYPLEFSECYLDSPWFRENVQKYEEELEKTNSQIKSLIKDARSMISAFCHHEKTIKLFSANLRHFQFDCIGENLTDNERVIAGSLGEFGIMLEEVAEEWSNTINRLELQLVPLLEKFRKEGICGYRESKKQFEKASERYYKQLESTLGLSHKRKPEQLKDADTDLVNLKKTFHQEALNYVYKLQEVEERKKFEFVEHLLMFMQVYFNYFHQIHETATDWKHYTGTLQSQLVTTRTQYEETREKTQTLMKKMMDHPESADFVVEAYGESWNRAGYLLLMEKNSITARLTSKWTKYFCMYMKDTKKFRMSLASRASSNSVGAALNINTNSTYTEPMTVKSCIRKMTDSLDRRFCFDLEMEDASGKQMTATFQATSLEDRKKWLSVMDGKEPEYVSTRVLTNKEDLCKLNDIGLQFVQNIIGEIERRGLQHEGMYRLVGITSKVNLLLQNALTPKTAPSVHYANDEEWETNTLTSALKSYFRNLPEPIMTFDLHRDFINAAKCENPEDRVKKVADLFEKLPEENKDALRLLTAHLEKVQQHSEENKMTIQNLGVCFGPTLMRERQETVQAILEIKFSNIIVEILTDERELLFKENDSKKEDASPHNLRVNTKSNFVKLPSQKIKDRPGGIVYSATTVPNILEYEDPMKSRDRSKINRLGAIRDHSKQSFLHRQSSTEQISQSSDENPYEDINVDKPSVPDHSEARAKLQQIMASKRSPLKKDPIPANGNAKPSKSKKTVTKQLSIGQNPLKPLLSRRKSSEEGDAPKSASKRRVSPRQRRQLKSTTDSTISENTNNSNDRPALPSKPKNMRESIKRGTNKFLLSMNDALGTPPQTKKHLKVFPNDEITKPVQRSKSTGSDLLNHIAASRRPKSDFIPPAFRVDEVGKDEQSKPDPIKNGRSKSPRPHSLTASNPTSPARSARSLSPRNAPPSDEDGDFSDDEVPSEMARTLYECQGGDGKELSFRPNQMVHEIRKSQEEGWVWGSIEGKRGLIPINYVSFLP